MATFGELVTARRERMGWSIQQCAVRANWSWPRWQRIEKDEPGRSDGRPPRRSPETVAKVAQALKWDLREALAAAGYGDSVYQDLTSGSREEHRERIDEDAEPALFYRGERHPLTPAQAEFVSRYLGSIEPEDEGAE